MLGSYLVHRISHKEALLGIFDYFEDNKYSEPILSIYLAHVLLMLVRRDKTLFVPQSVIEFLQSNISIKNHTENKCVYGLKLRRVSLTILSTMVQFSSSARCVVDNAKGKLLAMLEQNELKLSQKAEVLLSY